MPVGTEQPGGAQIVFIEPQPVEIEGVGGVLRLQGSASVVSAEVQDIVSLNSISTVSRAVTSNIQKVIPNDALSNINFFETAAYLDVDFNVGDSIAYIPDTTKFKPMGLLLIGDEVVRYARKLSDRFTNILRAQRGTTEQNWTAGTFLRQIPELVSVAPVGVVKIESESSAVQMVSASASAGGFERTTQRQIGASEELAVTKADLEFLVIPPPSGVVDGYAEEIFLTDPVAIRAGNTTGGHDGEVDLIEINDGYHVGKRNATEVLIVNSVFGRTVEYIGQYTKTNVGHTLSHFEGIFDDGAAGVSGLTLGELDLYFGSLTIRDFEERGKSSYTLAGDKMIMMPPSIQNPVTFSQTYGATIPSTVTVGSTNYFPNEGYLFHNTPGTQSPVGGLFQKQYGSIIGSDALETTTQAKFGSSSASLDANAGNGQYLEKVGMEFGTGDFTVEFWFNKETLAFPYGPGSLVYYGSNLLSGASWGGFGGNYFLPNFGFSMFVDNFYGATSSLKFWNGETGTYDTISGFISENTWYHVAIVRKSGTIKVYFDGVEKASRANSQDYSQSGATAASNAWGTNASAFFMIGSNNTASFYDMFNGFVDDVHLSSVARYDGNFTAPTQPSTPDGNTLVYDNFDVIVPSASGVIKYTGKTSNSFTGCTRYNGSNEIDSGSEIIPFSPV